MSSANLQILIIEDEIKLATVLKEYLEQADYSVHCIHKGDEVMTWLLEHTPALVVLDLMLPNIDGITLCQSIREHSDVPIIMATARVEESDRLKGLQIGADDYVCKPYSLKEMVARVQVVLRRSLPTQKRQQQETPTGSKAFQINQSMMSIETHGHTLDLTPVEFRLLSYLINKPGVVFSRDDLMNVIYDDYRLVSDRTIDSHIKNIRKKLLPHHPAQEIIHSIYGIGYKFQFNT